MRDRLTGEEWDVRAKVVVNATGQIVVKFGLKNNVYIKLPIQKSSLLNVLDLPNSSYG